jgi:hypothetical protein
VLLSAAWRGALHRAAAFTVTPELRDDDLRLADGHVALAWQNLGGWAGRRTIDYGPAHGGGIVFGAAVPFDGGGLHLIAPATLPGPHRQLGAVRFGTFLSRVANGDRIQNPWLWAMRGSLQPHQRFRIGVSRGTMFGGEGNTSLSARNLAYLIVGKHSGIAGELENHVVAVDAWVLAGPRSFPLAAYLEWGFDDSAGAWWDVPGITAGLELPAVPGAPELSLGIERTRFDGACCGNTMWYRNWSLRGGWTDGGRVLGHPLGGHGSEWLGHASLALVDTRLRAQGFVFRRRREAENLFAPEREGVSHGVRGSLQARVQHAWELDVRGEVERGADWTSGTLSTRIRAFVGGRPARVGAATTLRPHRSPGSIPTDNPRPDHPSR